ncbi:ATP-binding protein [Dactylosporangium sp. CS-033363]|uniref:ATP-binding protein n=1 Tax=Dactylosporangium sp. CS-033363 TaxID=3239935 RepID=UPI003D92D343
MEVFVGREHELAALASARAAAAAGEARPVLVCGDPGLGKTALLREFTRRARAGGATVLWGGAWEDGGAPPYWPWMQVLRQAGDDSPFTGAEFGSRFALFDAACAVLSRAPAPLVVVLDDLHAAGHPSALLLRFAAANLPGVLLVAALRPAEARLDPGLRSVVAALESSGTVLTLPGLAPAEIRLLLPDAGDAVLDAVARRGEGSPLFVTQVARLLGREAATVEEVPVPASIRQAVARLIAPLGPGAPDVLATAAALGAHVDPALVAALEEEPARAVLDGAAQSGLLVAGPGGYRFGHALIREALLADLTPLARAERHLHIAGALELPSWRGRTGAAELARHYRLAQATGPAAVAAAVRYATLAGDEALTALAPEEAAEQFRHALDALGRSPRPEPGQRGDLLLQLARALDAAADPGAAAVVGEAVELARRTGDSGQLAAAALLAARHLDFNAPGDSIAALLREAAEALPIGEAALRAQVLARLAFVQAPDLEAARVTADAAVAEAGRADPSEPAARAAALAARHHTRWGTQEPADALADASGIVDAARRARDPGTELDGRVLVLTHLLEVGDGPAARRVLPELDRLAGTLRHPSARLVALSRRAALATLDGDFAEGARAATEAWEAGRRAGLPDADAVRWGQVHAIWVHTDVPAEDLDWTVRTLRELVAHSHRAFAHAPALVQFEAAAGDVEQARGRLDDLVEHGLDRQRPDMVLVWALTHLAEAVCVLGAAEHARRVYRALLPYAGRAAVEAGAVSCSGATDFYLGRLAALDGDAESAGRHYRVAERLHRSLGARPMLARTLAELGEVAEARALAGACGMTRLLARLGDARLVLRLEQDGWLVAFAGESSRVPDSLGLRYLALLVRSPGREVSAVELVQLAASTGTGSTGEGLDMAGGGRGDEVLDARARGEYRRRLAELDDDLAEAEHWHDQERAARLRAERDFLIQELSAAAGLGGRTRRLGSDAERARLNVTRAIRTAIARIRERAPATGAHLDAAVRTGTRCSYRPG